MPLRQAGRKVGVWQVEGCIGTKLLQWNLLELTLRIKDTSLMRTVSAVPTT